MKKKFLQKENLKKAFHPSQNWPHNRNNYDTDNESKK